MKTLLLKLLGRKEKFGPRIFEQDSWLTKQINAAMLKPNSDYSVTLGEVKEQS